MAPFTYTWSPAGGNASTTTSVPAGTYTVFVIAANGCLASAVSPTIVQPTALFSTITTSNVSCFGGTNGTATVTAGGGTPGYTYTWLPSSSTGSVVSSLSAGVYSVQIKDANNCVLTSTYSITQPTAALAATASSTAVSCFGGGNGSASATASGGTGPLTYTWNNGLGSGPGAFVTIPTQPTTYIVTVTNSCGSSVTDSARVVFTPPPTMAVASSGTLSCIPTSINFFDNSITGDTNDPITSWSWNFGDGTTSSGQNPSHTYTTPGTYSVSVTVTTGGGCTNNSASSPIVVSAYPYPVASFSINAGVLNLPYDALHCTNQSTGATIYSWNFGDGNTSTAVDPTHNYNAVGVFQIQLIATSPYGCSDTAYRQVVTDADVVFPNAFTPNSDGPSGGYYVPGSLDNDIFFPYTSGVIDYKFQIFDRWGELIFETEDIKQGWDGYYRGKICQLGVYVWKAYVKLNNGKEFRQTGDITLLR